MYYNNIKVDICIILVLQNTVITQSKNKTVYDNLNNFLLLHFKELISLFKQSYFIKNVKTIFPLLFYWI